MKEHDRLLKEWQKRLGLTDWVIRLYDNCKPGDMALADSTGCTSWVESTKVARVEMLDPAYYEDRIIPYDWEQTLVHELLHLKTCLISNGVDDLQERYMHQMIDELAKAFVDAKRHGV